MVHGGKVKTLVFFQALSEVSLHYFIFLISGMNVAYKFSNEDLSQGLISNAAIKGRLRNKLHLHFLCVGVERCSLGFML